MDRPAGEAIDSLTPMVAFGLAAGIVVVNLKNLPLLISTGGDIARAGLSIPEAIGAAVILGVVASLGALVPVGVYLLGGTTAAGVLASWRGWLVQNNASVMAVLFLILGVSKLGAAVSGLL